MHCIQRHSQLDRKQIARDLSLLGAECLLLLQLITSNLCSMDHPLIDALFSVDQSSPLTATKPTACHGLLVRWDCVDVRRGRRTCPLCLTTTTSDTLSIAAVLTCSMLFVWKQKNLCRSHAQTHKQTHTLTNTLTISQTHKQTHESIWIYSLQTICGVFFLFALICFHWRRLKPSFSVF